MSFCNDGDEISCDKTVEQSKTYIYLSSVVLQLCWGYEASSELCNYYERWIWRMWELALLCSRFSPEMVLKRIRKTTRKLSYNSGHRIPPECVGHGLLLVLCHVSRLTQAYKLSTNDLNFRGTVNSHKVGKGVFQCTMKILQIRSLLFFIPSLSLCSFSVYTDLMLHR